MSWCFGVTTLTTRPLVSRRLSCRCPLLSTDQVHPMEIGKTLMNSFMFNLAYVPKCCRVD